MQSLLFWGLVLIISLAVLIKSSDYFTEAAEKVGIFFGLPQFIVGVTIVSIGTSLPELSSSLIAVLQGSSEFVVGNSVGSSIANILLVIGVVSIYSKKLSVDFELVKIDVPLLLGSALLLTYLGYDGVITFWESIILILGYIIYIEYNISEHKNNDKELTSEESNISWLTIIILAISSIGIYLGAKFTIDSVVKIAKILELADTSLIALTAVAIGTSLPELMASIMAAKKGNQGMALGNVLGSNIFNSFLAIGIPGLLGNLNISSSIINIGFPFLIIATFLYIISTLDKEVSRYEGAMFLIFYIVFITKLIGLI